MSYRDYLHCEKCDCKMNNLFLRTCNADGTSHGGFRWNLEIGGITEAPDWNPEPECGGGLHGLLNGKGEGGHLNHSKDALWMVCEALGPIVDIDHKIKTSKAKTLFVGDRKGATDFLIASGCNPSEVVGAFITGGDDSTVTGGDRSTVTGGKWSTVTGGISSTVTGGDYSTVTGGQDSTVTGGYRSTVTGGEFSTVTGGYWSTVTGGNGSVLSLKWFDGRRDRIITAYVGEDGIEPNVPYKLDENGKFVRA